METERYRLQLDGYCWHQSREQAFKKRARGEVISCTEGHEMLMLIHWLGREMQLSGAELVKLEWLLRTHLPENKTYRYVLFWVEDNWYRYKAPRHIKNNLPPGRVIK